MKTGQILNVKEFNELQSIKYGEDCTNWDHKKGGFPQIAFYLCGKEYGYVLITKHGSSWAKTKKGLKV